MRCFRHWNPGGKLALSKHIIVGTAGHIDHGKTALVKALTGIDADRWEEEKRRGITIDLGFAHLDLGPDLRLGFIDVPGHERFVRNMLAGAGGIDLLLLVIAADESIMPQTREHFDICRLLDIRQGVVALTKADLVEPDLLDLVKLEVEDYLAGSFLAGAPMVAVSSKTGQGLDPLRAVLRQKSETIQPKNGAGHFRLPIDRAFAMKGFGTVVTGTLVSGSLEVESEVEVHPSGRRARVRGIQVHGQACPRAIAGQRTAANLAGIDVEELERGMALAAPGRFQPTRVVDCLLTLLASAKPLKHGAPLHFHSGTAETVAKVRFHDQRPRLKPGEQAFARIETEKALLVLPRDRFIVRQFSPLVTLGGGVVLDSQPPVRRTLKSRIEALEAFAEGLPETSLDTLLRDAPFGMGAEALVTRTAWPADTLQRACAAIERTRRAVRISEEPPWLVHAEALDAAASAAIEFLARFHQQNPLSHGAPKEELRSSVFPKAPVFFVEALFARLAKERKIAVESDLVRLAAHRIVLREDEQEARDKMVSAFQQAGLKVPGLGDFLAKLSIDPGRAGKLLRALLREGILVRVSEDMVFHADSIAELKQMLASHKQWSDRLNVASFKDLAGISRKYAIPLLEYLDREKITRRVGDSRVIL
jgi:selenocysteine-specific elongation factor